ncbi:hypothetical protein OG455_26915 [Kitasatospora sp. NBC_01287]|nr:hypothetical protein [Kitasatospora sp. NBC_01287]MCX4749097.1 hypothetical protein [Kitasatospora sp. NBC_01287]
MRSCQYLDRGNNTAGVLIGALLGMLLLRRRDGREQGRATA